VWNNEETGLNGAAPTWAASALQGKETRRGGQYPEPTWLGMIQHDMCVGSPHAARDGSLSPEQRPEADVNIEFVQRQFAPQRNNWRLCFRSQREVRDRLSRHRRRAHDQHRSRLPGRSGGDQSARERARHPDRGGVGPHWHQPTDVYATYSDKDFPARPNAAQTTLAAVAGLVGATIK